MDTAQKSCYTYRKRIPFEELTLADDFLFCKVMQNEKLCKELLEIILHVKIKRIVYTDTQKVLDNTIDEKSVRMDVYVQDDKHTVYDIEMQTSDTKELPKRSRYYHSCIDKSQISKGEKYNALRKTYVIFICTFDLFGKNFAKYEFDTICKQDNSLILADDRHTIFVNAEGVTNDQKLKDFLHYLKTGEITKSPFILDLSREVRLASRNSKWKEEYDMLLAYDERKQKEGQEQIILRALQKHSPEVVAEFLDIPLEDIEEVQKKAKLTE